MPSTTPSTPTTRVSEVDFDMEVDIDTNASTAVTSSPVPSVAEHYELSKKTIGIIGDDVSGIDVILLRVVWLNLSTSTRSSTRRNALKRSMRSSKTNP